SGDGLPGGVTFDAATGILGGTPAAGTGGAYHLVFIAHNGVGSDASQGFTFIVNQGPRITSAPVGAFTVGTPATFAVTASGMPAPTFSESGALPSGVTFDPVTA